MIRLTYGNPTFYHVITFAKFHVTCVQTSKNTAWDEEMGKVNGCPGHDAAVSNIYDDPLTGDKVGDN